MFVLLSAAMPSRLLTAFPPGVPVRRVPLDEAIERVRRRLAARPHRSAGRPSRMKTLTPAAPRQVELGRSGRSRFRPAAQRARAQARRGAMGKQMRERRARLRPASLACPALRVVETLDGLAERLRPAARRSIRPSDLPRVDRRPARPRSASRPTRSQRLLLVGHNPGLERAAAAADRRRRRWPARARSRTNYPTAALAEIELAGRALGATSAPASGRIVGADPARASST